MIKTYGWDGRRIETESPHTHNSLPIIHESYDSLQDTAFTVISVWKAKVNSFIPLSAATDSDVRDGILYATSVLITNIGRHDIIQARSLSSCGNM